MNDMSTSPAGTGISDEIAVEIAGLGLVGASSKVRTLRKVTELAPRAVAGCAGATTVHWEGTDPPEPVISVGTHPALAQLVDLQTALGTGPIFDAVAAGAPVACDDTLSEVRWPVLVPAMLRRGVRCFSTTVYRKGEVQVTLTLYGVLPGALDPGQPAIATLLLGQGGAAMSNARQYDLAHRTAVQLQESVATRAVVDQAKGILMHALGYDAEQAFEELLRLSQTRHVKLTALARHIVSAGGARELS